MIYSPTTRRIVPRPRGSWKYQNAYAITTYTVRRARDGRHLWTAYGSTPKLSEPQIRRQGDDMLESGSQHNRPVSDDRMAFDPAFPLMMETE